MSRRTERIAEQIQGEVARVLRTETTDPRIGLVTITRVDVAPDLSHALVFWSALSSDDPEAIARVEAGHASAAPYLRRRRAQVLRCGACPSCASADPPRPRQPDAAGAARDRGR
jgi:ribosome-binding factor A